MGDHIVCSGASECSIRGKNHVNTPQQEIRTRQDRLVCVTVLFVQNTKTKYNHAREASIQGRMHRYNSSAKGSTNAAVKENILQVVAPGMFGRANECFLEARKTREYSNAQDVSRKIPPHSDCTYMRQCATLARITGETQCQESSTLHVESSFLSIKPRTFGNAIAQLQNKAEPKA